MINDIGVRDLKAHASAIIRRVWKKKDHYVLTYRGRPVGLISPIEQANAHTKPSSEAVWDELDRIASRIADGWRSRKSSVEILSEMRR